MPSSGQDGRVRTPLSLQEQLEHLHFHETPALCKSPCCSPLRPSQSPHLPDNRHDMSSTPRPALNRSAASHHTDKSSKSAYSTGTDGSSRAQSEDGYLPTFLTKFVDGSTFDQVRHIHYVENYGDRAEGIRSSRWTKTRTSASSAGASSSTSSTRPKTHSVPWKTRCKPSPTPKRIH